MIDPQHKQHRLLLADDDSTCLGMLAEFFKDEGFEVMTVDNGSAALEALATEGLSLLVTDLNMPGANGLDLLSFVKRERSAIPVIIITANSDAEAKEQARVMGAADYITKPIDLDDLLARVENQLS